MCHKHYHRYPFCLQVFHKHLLLPPSPSPRLIFYILLEILSELNLSPYSFKFPSHCFSKHVANKNAKFLYYSCTYFINEKYTTSCLINLLF
jgi:hypothetical protein